MSILFYFLFYLWHMTRKNPGKHFYYYVLGMLFTMLLMVVDIVIVLIYLL